MNAAAVTWLILGLIVVYVARVFILKACCAVSDVKEPGYLLGALWALLVLTLVLGSAFFLQWLFSKLDADPEVLLAPMRITGVLIALVVSWALTGLFYWLVLSTTPFKGLWVAAIELLLNLLVGVLLTCLWLIGLALWQMGGPELVVRVFSTLLTSASTLLIWTAWSYLFSKAKRPAWAAFAPIYNIVVLVNIAGKPIWWVVLFLIPGVNLVMHFIVALEVAKKFGKGVGFGIGLGLLPVVFYPILGFGAAEYEGQYDVGERMAPAPA
jgi:hypothetical protein